MPSGLQPSRLLKQLESKSAAKGGKTLTQESVFSITHQQINSMRGADTFTASLFTMRHLEDFVPSNNSSHPVRQMVNEALVLMDGLFYGRYEADIKGGRPSIAPEKLLRAMLL